MTEKELGRVRRSEPFLLHQRRISDSDHLAKFRKQTHYYPMTKGINMKILQIVLLLALAQISESTDNRQILLRRVVTASPKSTKFEVLDTQEQRKKQTYFVQISSENEKKQKAKASIEKILGIDVLSNYIPHNTYRIYCIREQLLAIEQLEDVLLILSVEPQHKWDDLAFLKNTKNKKRNEVGRIAEKDIFDGYKLDVLLVGEILQEDLEKLITKTREQFKEHELLSFIPTKSKMKLKLSFAHEDLMLQAKEWLSHQPEVVWIERKVKEKPLNFFAKGVVQGGSNQDQTLWEQGLTGEGEIVSVGDTGLDANHCFFWDRFVGFFSFCFFSVSMLTLLFFLQF